MYWIGIDGGGTKTEFLVTDTDGNILCRRRVGTIACKQVGKERSVQILKEVLDSIFEELGLTEKDNIYTCCAFPNWGESRMVDSFVKNKIEKDLPKYHIYLVNDCEVGWAGSLGMEMGINLVAGTGAIAFGKDGEGRMARAGGWSDFFSDEGSCNWFGKKTMELFSKESDGRAEKGPLLEIMREEFGLSDDYEIIDIFENNYQNDRTKIASLQKLLLKAAKYGDEGAVKLYEEGAHELALSVLAVYRKLKFKDECIVSYSGGLFHAADYVLVPLGKALEKYSISIKKPLFSPVHGAVLLAALYWGSEKEVQKLKNKWLYEQN